MRLAVAACALLVSATGAAAQIFPDVPVDLEILMDRLQAADTDLVDYGLLAFYTISYYDPPILVDRELARLDTLLPEAGPCRYQNLSGPELWDSLLRFFTESRLPRRALENLRDAERTLNIVARGWDGVSGTGAECSVGVYKIFFDIGKYMTLNFDYRGSFGTVPAQPWWEGR